MSLTVNTNIAAMNAYRNLTVTDNQMAHSLEKLSSGYRINRAADDAAGLVVSEGLRSQIGGLKVAVRNAQDGISVAQTAEGALNETTAILQRMRDLASQAASTGSGDGGVAEQAEVTQLNSELDHIASSTTFGGKALLDGKYSGTFNVGSSATGSDLIGLTINNGTTSTGFSASDLGVSTLSLTASASAAVSAIDAAIAKVSAARGNIGAVQNRFEHTINNLNVAVQNLSASESRIRDTDMAQEMTSYTKAQILSQAGTAMLAQANHSADGVLQLLR